jgi:plasmid stability protein
VLPKTAAPESLHARVGAYAARRGLSLAGAIRELLTAGLDATEKPR